MKKNTILVILGVAALIGYLVYSSFSSTMQVTNTIEENSFSVEIPKSFEPDSEYPNTYISDDNSMFIEYYYYADEFNLGAEAMLHIVTANQFLPDDIVSIDKVDINGNDAYQAQYRTLTTGTDGIHYYFSGLMTAFEMNDEFFVFDAYQSMEESVGINTTISDDDLELLSDITNTITITNASFSNTDTSVKSQNLDKLTLNLSTNWDDATQDENGFYDFGYYASFRFNGLPLEIYVYEYNDENIADLEVVKSNMDLDEYNYLGEVTVGGEVGYAYSYNAYSSDGEAPYVYGVFTITEHYTADLYFYSQLDDYRMSNEIVESFKEMLGSIE